MEATILLSDQAVAGLLSGNLRRIIEEGRRSIRPVARIAVSEWADRNRVLPETSVEPGPWRTDRAPHTREIMDAIMSADVRQVTVMGSAQIGKTEMINNIIAYHIDVAPCAVMVMQPTEKDARDYVLQKLEPMLEDTRCLTRKVAKKKSRDSENSIFRKKIAGGYLTIVSGTAASSLRGRSAKVTIGDDIDAIRVDITNEGDPILRLIKRSTTYPDHLNWNISTPTYEGESRIETLYKQGTMERYNVQCPYCGEWIVLMEEQLVWEKEMDMFGKVLEHKVGTVLYACQRCGAMINEGQRMEMLRRGRWVAERPHSVYHRSFWLNELSSTLSSMVKVARAMVDAGVDVINGEIDAANATEANCVALWNTVFGRPFPRVKGSEIDPMGLIERIEDYMDDRMVLPAGVLLLTAAVDVQAGMRGLDARLEVKIMGWGVGEEAWIVYRDVVPGNLKDRAIWEALDRLWEKKWRTADGRELQPVVKLVDSGFESETVYAYTTPRYSKGVIATKGSNKYGASLLPNKMSRVNKGRTPLMYVGTQAAKHELLSNLQNVKEQGPRYVHFCKRYCDAEYFRQLTSEHAVIKRTGLIEYVVFEKKTQHVRNEVLDLLVLCYAGMRYLLPNWEALKRRGAAQSAPEITKKEPDKERFAGMAQARNMTKYAIELAEL